MGLDTKTRDPIYLSINNGKFIQRVMPETRNAIKRVNSLNKTVYELHHDSLTASLINIITDTTGEYGAQWKLVMADKGQAYIINLLCNSPYAFTFLCALPNIDLTEEFTLYPSSEEKDGKTRYALWVNQKNSSVKWKFTSANPNGLPELKQKKGKGKNKDKIIYDNTQRMDFFQDIIENEILPQIQDKTKPN